MNRARKGRRIEALALAVLRSQGYVLHRTRRSSYITKGRRRSGGNDVFGCVDIIAKRSHGAATGEQRTRWIQCTADRAITRKRTALSRIPWNPLHDSVEIWRYIGGTGPRIDRRTGLPRLRNYFQVYHLDQDYRRDPKNREFPKKRQKP